MSTSQTELQRLLTPRKIKRKQPKRRKPPELTPEQKAFNERQREIANSPNANWRNPEWIAKREANRKRISSLGGKAHAGHPKGWTREEYSKYRYNVRKYAKKILKKLIPLMPEENVALLNEDAMAKQALVKTITIMKDRTVKPETQLAAARTVLEWTKQKPATKSDVTLKRPEDFLAALARKERGEDEPRTIEYTEEAPRQLPVLRGDLADDQDEARDNRESDPERSAENTSGSD